MEPGRIPNRSPEATRAQNGETLICYDSTKDFGVFLVPQAPCFEPKVDPKWVPNRIFDAEALRKPLESLLEASGAETKKLGTALCRFGAETESKMAHKFLRTPDYGVPHWGPKLYPHFIASQEGF